MSCSQWPSLLLHPLHRRRIDTESPLSLSPNTHILPIHPCIACPPPCSSLLRLLFTLPPSLPSVPFLPSSLPSAPSTDTRTSLSYPFFPFPSPARSTQWCCFRRPLDPIAYSTALFLFFFGDALYLFFSTLHTPFDSPPTSSSLCVCVCVCLYPFDAIPYPLGHPILSLCRNSDTHHSSKNNAKATYFFYLFIWRSCPSNQPCDCYRLLGGTERKGVGYRIVARL